MTRLLAACLVLGAAGAFRAAPAADFAVAPGGPIDATAFRYVRALFPGAPGPAVVTLAPADLAALQPGLADLRVVDPGGAQVPYLLVTTTGEQPVALEVDGETRTARKSSEYTLRVSPGAGLDDGILPLRGVSLTVGEGYPYFRRHARVLAPGPAAEARRLDLDEAWRRARQGRSVLFDGTIQRTKGQGEPIRIRFSEQRVGELLLVIENGDSAPIVIREAEGFVPVWRVVFPVGAGGGEYRLLLGSASAERPDYDIDAPDPEGLAAGATTADHGPLVPNPSYRPRLADYLTGAPRTGLLWAVIGVAVVALIWLTLRLMPKRERRSRFPGD